MTTPALAAGRFGIACLLGGMLGVLYSFLRPLRPKGTTLADGIFLLALFYAWLQLGFRVCQGDLRMGYTAGLFLGILLWEMTAGKWLRPLFFGFWGAVDRVIQWLFRPVKKFFLKNRQKAKNVFASWKKWVTMIKNNRRNMRRTSGGTHGKDPKSSGIHQTGIQKNTEAGDHHRVGGRCIVYGGTSDAPRSH